MKLLVQSATAILEESIEFFDSLEFEKLQTENNLLFRDSNYIVDINPNRYSRTGLKFYSENWEEAIEKIKELVNIEKFEEYYQLTDPSGTKYFLYPASSYPAYSSNAESKSILGNLMGIGLETNDILLSKKVLEIIGFKQNKGDVNSGWINMNYNDEYDISLMKSNMSPHLFFNPSLIYFNGEKNPEIIEKVRKKGIEIYEEIRVFNKENKVDNIMLRDKGGLGFFVFND